MKQRPKTTKTDKNLKKDKMDFFEDTHFYKNNTPFDLAGKHDAYLY